MTISTSYQRRLDTYLAYAKMDKVSPHGHVTGMAQSPDGVSPEEAVFRFESKGERNIPCSDVAKAYLYLMGKSNRDFYTANWTKDCKAGLFQPEEFLGIGGMDIEEFRAVFNRFPDLGMMRRIMFFECAEAFSRQITIRRMIEILGRRFWKKVCSLIPQLN